MNKLLSVFLILVYSYSINAQTLVRVDSFSFSYLKTIFPYEFKDSTLSIFYKIQYTLSKKVIKLGSFDDFLVNVENVDTLKLIEELLNFKGDERLCAIPIRMYGMAAHNNYDIRRIHYCSLQTEALFIIDRLFLPKPLRYSPYPLLVSTRRDIKLSEKIMIDKAYSLYERWFKKLKKIGLAKAMNTGIEPLRHSIIEWYR